MASDIPQDNKVVKDAANILLKFPEEITAADGAKALIHSKEGGRLSNRIIHLLKTKDRERGRREVFDASKTAWFPRLADTIENAQAKLKDPETGNLAYVRRYTEGIHVVLVPEAGELLDSYDYRLITQFGNRFGSSKRDGVEVLWESSAKTAQLSNPDQGFEDRNANGGVAYPDLQQEDSQRTGYNVASSLKDVKLSDISAGTVIRGATSFGDYFDQNYQANPSNTSQPCRNPYRVFWYQQLKLYSWPLLEVK